MAVLKMLLAIVKVVLLNPRTREELADIVATIFGALAARGEAPRKISSPEAVRAQAVELNLLRPAWFDTQTPAEWAAVWNGYGPDSWPAWMRSAVTWIYRYQEVVAAPHDSWFSRSDGTRATWLLVMDQWIANARAVLAVRFPLWKVWLLGRRALEWGKLEAAIAVLKAGSFDAWVEAHQRLRT